MNSSAGLGSALPRLDNIHAVAWALLQLRGGSCGEIFSSLELDVTISRGMSGLTSRLLRIVCPLSTFPKCQRSASLKRELVCLPRWPGTCLSVLCKVSPSVTSGTKSQPRRAWRHLGLQYWSPYWPTWRQGEQQDLAVLTYYFIEQMRMCFVHH